MGQLTHSYYGKRRGKQNQELGVPHLILLLFQTELLSCSLVKVARTRNVDLALYSSLLFCQLTNRRKKTCSTTIWKCPPLEGFKTQKEEMGKRRFCQHSDTGTNTGRKWEKQVLSCSSQGTVRRTPPPVCLSPATVLLPYHSVIGNKTLRGEPHQ